jgi:3-oxoacyl-[acyl-carrier protein] reductase
MELGLKGKKALITGASYGLGHACAVSLAEEGVDIAISSRYIDKIDLVSAEIAAKTGVKVVGIAADLTKMEDLEKTTREAQERLGDIDILIVSTGHPPTYPFSEATDEQWQYGHDLVLRPPIVLTRMLLDGMRKRNYGRVIYIGSTFGIEAEASSVVQSTLRTGLNALAKCIATEVAADGVTVNVVCPGLFDTPLVYELAKQYATTHGVSAQEVVNAWKYSAPVKKFGKAEDLGALIAFLASPKGEFITGTAITIDGGALKQY